MFTIIISLLMTYKCLYKHLFIHILLPFMTVYPDMNASIPARFVISICSLSSRADIRSAPRLMTVCCSSPSEVATVTLYLSRMPNTVFSINASAVSSCFVYTTSMLWKFSLSGIALHLVRIKHQQQMTTLIALVIR